MRSFIYSNLLYLSFKRVVKVLNLKDVLVHNLNAQAERGVEV
jgi:hypothetical protein